MTKLLAMPLIAVTVLTATTSIAADFGAKDIQRAIDTYRQNEMRFQRDFVGRSIEFVWVFDKASSRFFGNGYRVSFGNGGFNGGVDCIVSDQETLDKIVEWNKGQRAFVSGTIDDVSVGDLKLKNCKIEARWKAYGGRAGSTASHLHSCTISARAREKND